MKKILYLVIIIASIVLVACDRNDITPIHPSDISNIQYESKPGSIKLTWDVPADSNLSYVKVKYYDYLKKKEMIRLASLHSDSIIIPNTREKYGDYIFTLQSISSTETGGTVKSITAVSGPAPITLTIDKSVPLTLSADNIFADYTQGTGNPVSHLIDNDKSTIWHGQWSPAVPMPHYLVVKLPKKVHALSFCFINRTTADKNNFPNKISIYASNEFDGQTFDVSEMLPFKIIESGLPDGSASEYNSPEIILDDEYQYFWLQVRSTHGGGKFFTLAELSINEVVLNINDPEALVEGE